VTTTTAAKRLGCSRRTVQRWCRNLGWPKEGRDWMLSLAQVDLLAASVHDGPGNPGQVRR